MSDTRKRLRASAASALAALRADIASRSDPTPASWKAAAAAAGVSGTDAFLCHLGRSIATSLQTVSVSAEAALAQLRATRVALLSAVNSRCDELEEGISDASSSKVSTLERELCAVDAALELWRAEDGIAAEAASALSDGELLAQHSALSARLDAVETQLADLPTTCVEPPHVGFASDTPTVLAALALFGRVVSPRAITAGDLVLKCTVGHVCPGYLEPFRLVLESPRHALQTADELAVSLGAAAASTLVDAALETDGDLPLPLQATISVDVLGRCVSFSIPASLLTQAGATVVVNRVTVAGRLIRGAAWPLCFPVRRGMLAPFTLSAETVDGFTTSDLISLCVSGTGQIFVPQGASVHVFDCDGARLPIIPITAFGIKTPATWAAFADGETPSLLIADDHHTVVALDPATRLVRWANSQTPTCSGIAVLRRPGVAIVASAADDALVVLRLSDGKQVGRLRELGQAQFFAADPISSACFGSMELERDLWDDFEEGASYDSQSPPIAVSHFAWEPASGLRLVRTVDSAGWYGEGGDSRPLAVVPPLLGKLASHLVVGTMFKSELLVLALPSLTCVHRHLLDGVGVTALAADPWGVALVVGDTGSGTIHVLSWPLPGMPALK